MRLLGPLRADLAEWRLAVGGRGRRACVPESGGNALDEAENDEDRTRSSQRDPGRWS